MPSDSTPAREAVEFQPDALEIQYETLPWYGRSGILWGLLAVAALFVWACLSKVEVIITGPGRVVADRNIVMKPLERSVIKSIEVAEGDIVQKGQVLINFDPEINLANAERLEAQIRSRKVEFERCQAEFADQPFSPALDQDENVRWQIAIYQQRQTYFRERLNFYAEREKQLLAAWQSTQESLNKQREVPVQHPNHRKHVLGFARPADCLPQRAPGSLNHPHADRVRAEPPAVVTAGAGASAAVASGR